VIYIVCVKENYAELRAQIIALSARHIERVESRFIKMSTSHEVVSVGLELDTERSQDPVL